MGRPGVFLQKYPRHLGPFGAAWLVFWRSRFFLRLRGGLGGDPVGSSKKKRFWDDVWSLLAPLFDLVSCLFGASPALFFEVVWGRFLGRVSSCLSSLFVLREKGGHAWHTVKNNRC